MTDEEMHKIAKLQALFARSKELDKQIATRLVIVVDSLIEAHARGNTRSVETGLLMLRRILGEQSGD